MQHRHNVRLLITLLLLTTVSCASNQPVKLPTNQFSTHYLENQATQRVVEVVFKSGKTQQAVINLMKQRYWRLVSDNFFEIEDIDKLKIKDKEGNLLTEITSDSLANVVLVFTITGKGLEKLGELF